MKKILLFVLCLPQLLWAQIEVLHQSQDKNSFPVVAGSKATRICFDVNDYEVVKKSGNLLASDIERVTGKKPQCIAADKSFPADEVIIVGTVEKNRLINQLVTAKKLDVAPIRGQWERFVIKTVENPFPGVKKALVIAGSDRRGTAYGVFSVSEAIGVSPWYWWADVPVVKRSSLSIKNLSYTSASPSVKYRGIFINDEDWGMYKWAKQTFDPAFGNIGPKTYEKVFELMLRLRLNYIWPAMHECSTEFGLVPENVAMADRYGIVAGSSHCEPMLCNNIHWDQKAKGPWNYSLNRDTIHAYWAQSVKERRSEEAVWTLGIRGIHDRGMETPPVGIPDRINLVQQVFDDQRALINQNVTKEWGDVAQCFVPYKEVLPLYDAGLKVPDDVTIMWVDDNFGYIRRLGAAAERTRSGGAGVYWHLSYYGGPHSYLWMNTTPPALMWEELHKAWENDARKIWVLNVGDLKPMEIGMDYFARFAWNINEKNIDSQPQFLSDFAKKQFGENEGQPIADLLGEFYRLGTIRKPEEMNRMWAVSLPREEALQLKHDYQQLLDNEAKIAVQIDGKTKDAYFEMVGFSARVLGAAGLIFMADRDIQLGSDSVAATKEIVRLCQYIDEQVASYNNDVAGGKWKYMMPGKETETAKSLMDWNSQVRWPWGEKGWSTSAVTANPDRKWRDANSADRRSSSGKANWKMIQGLGATGKALALKPAGLESSWNVGDNSAPCLEYDFQTKGGDNNVLIDFLPSFRICPGMQLRVHVSIDNQISKVVEVLGSSGKEDENGSVRSNGIMNNYVQAKVELKGLVPGKHTLKIYAVDPGVVIDRISFPMD
ncbi:glycosyl hydrolase 115 family protein [Paludibacter sp.]|uniref:glycosyl hydrolase 115 family protein n=1 Tax=Paludibacter sp. TaxID=1898105 RepID=UPI0013523CD7|nr:glycosyl hydrolase 115 family protein [Paludibacter sp.]MTK53238.1 hypothetical protein [Paludibacter sp.]